jgi:hypothetical protein
VDLVEKHVLHFVFLLKNLDIFLQLKILSRDSILDEKFGF